MNKETVIASRYQLSRQLGEGGFGQTWLAQDLLRRDEDCVVKLLVQGGKASDLTREFKVLQSLYHPHIVEVIDCGRSEAHPYLVTEFIDGSPLDKGIKNIKGKAWWEIIAQLCRALSYIHSKGIVHGDLKPDNVLLEKKAKRVKLIDFGLATLHKAPKGQKDAAGTLAYMAPEVITRGTRTKKSDLYALGVILYQLLNGGRLPFRNHSESMIHFHLHEEPSFTFLARNPWQKTLESLLASLLDKNPARRPNDALEIITTLNKKQKLSLPVHRSAVASAEESLLFQTIDDYLHATDPLLQLSSVQNPQSFLDAEGQRIKKYLSVASDLPKKDAAELIDRLHETQMRLLIQQGRYRDALKKTGQSPRLKNVRALAQIYLEKFSDAEKLLKDAHAKATYPIDRARSLNYLGMAAYNKGELDEARPYFEKSLKEMKRLREATGIVSNSMNLAAIAQQKGEIASALQLYREALKAASNLHNTFLLAILLSNMANLLLQVGSLKESEEHLNKSTALAEQLGMRFITGYNLLLQADIAMWRKDSDSADRILEKAIKHFKEIKAAQYLSLAWVSYAENAFRSHQRGALLVRINKAAAAVAKSCLPETRFRLDVLKIQHKMLQSQVPKKLPPELTQLEKKASGSKQEFRILAIKALWALGKRDQKLAEEFLAAMQEVFEKNREAIPIAYRGNLAGSSLYAILWELQERLRHMEESPADVSLWHLVEINKRIAAQHDTKNLYDIILDAAIELTGAERGFLITPGSSKREVWTIQSARAFQKRDLPGGRDLLSQTVIKRLLKSKEPLLIQNALEEKDLAKFRSVQALKLRSILAAPIIMHGEILGVLYVDHSQTANLFEKKNIELIKAFADQAGIALNNARLYQEALSRQHELDEAHQKLEEYNRRLQTDLEETSDLADRLDEELKKIQHVGAIAVRSVAMKHILKQLPTLATLRRPVVLSGETGTGKDLIAKALHQHTDSSPLVIQFAGQLPRWKTDSLEADALLQAFEQARGGTLYIDEISELTIPYQKELLTFLRSQRDRKDHEVFCILSARLGLKETLKKGLLSPELNRFLTGSEIRIPPLRKRKEDITPLVNHFLRELDETRGLKRKISRSSLSLLQKHDWPGNVRELELEIERAALSAQLTIGPTELSPNLLQEVGFIPGAPKRIQPDLQDQRSGFERDLILQALEKTGWNKARAAKQLGLSRAMLYIKINKYQIPLQ